MNARPVIRDDDIRAMLLARADASTFPGLLDQVMEEVRSDRRPRAIRVPARASGWFRVAALAAAAGLAVVAIALSLRPSDVIGPPSPSPAVSPSPTAQAAPSAVAESSIKPMGNFGLNGPATAAGTYRTVNFGSKFTFTVPAARWVPALDSPRQWLLRAGSGDPESGVDALTIVRLENVYVDPCTKGFAAGTEPWTGDASAFFEWLATNAPIPLGTPTPTTLFGQPALELELVQPDLGQCEAGYLPISNVGRDFATGPTGQPTRYTAVDIDGQTLLVTTWASDPARWDEVRAAADAVLSTVQFTN